MRHPSDRVTGTGASDGSGGPHATPRLHLLERAALAALFAVRGAASLIDASSAMGLGLRPGLSVGPISVNQVSPIWPAVWGVLALAAAFSLGLRLRLGWILAVGVTVAYVVSGIADLSVVVAPTTAASPAGGPDLSSPTIAALALVEVVIPMAILAALAAVRHQYLPHGSRPRRVARIPGAPSTLERWRSRR